MDAYEAYLFDWDGTVAQTLSVWLPIVRKTLDEHGIEISDKDIVLKVFGTVRSGLYDLGIPEEDFSSIFAEWDKTAAVSLPKAPLYDGILDVFKTLRGNGKKLAVVTATIRPHMEKVFAAHGLRDDFEVVVTGSDVKAPKPDPESILLALRQLGVPKERAIMLGDSDKDIGAAHNAGIDSVLFHPPEHQPYHSLDHLKRDKPTHVIHSWHELLKQLQ